MSEELAAIPELAGVTLYRMPPLDVCGEPGALTVEVSCVQGSAGPEGRGKRRTGLVPVELDRAHDLSWRGPEVYVWPETGGIRGVTRWSVTALGFIEDEARDAFDAVCAAINAQVQSRYAEAEPTAIPAPRSVNIAPSPWRKRGAVSGCILVFAFMVLALAANLADSKPLSLAGFGCLIAGAALLVKSSC